MRPLWGICLYFYHLKKFSCLKKYERYFKKDVTICYESTDKSKMLLVPTIRSDRYLIPIHMERYKYYFIIDVKNDKLLSISMIHDLETDVLKLREYHFSFNNVFMHIQTNLENMACSIVGSTTSQYTHRRDFSHLVKITYLKARLIKLIQN